MIEPNYDLTVEQSFQLAQLKLATQQMTREELQQRLVAVYEVMLKQHSRYCHLLAKDWGLK
jgi:hypothetical protein